MEVMKLLKYLCEHECTLLSMSRGLKTGVSDNGMQINNNDDDDDNNNNKYM